MGILGFFKKKDKIEDNDKLDMSSSKISKGLLSIFSRSKIDDEVLEEVEELLIQADVGVATTDKILDKVRRDKSALKDIETFKLAIKNSILDIINISSREIEVNKKPYLTLIVGVNGVGKTTTIAKLANLLKSDGKKPLLVAGDTFRAAASDQLSIWAERLSLPIIKGDDKSDPASVVYDGISYAMKNGIDIVLVDTAGRLQNKSNLMNELAKIEKVANKVTSSGFDERLLILDATSGQNVISQAKEFNQLIGITGIILTKLDGTAKGGTVIRVIDELKIPILFIGVGERVEDIKPFNANEFIDSILK